MTPASAAIRRAAGSTTEYRSRYVMRKARDIP